MLEVFNRLFTFFGEGASLLDKYIYCFKDNTDGDGGDSNEVPVIVLSVLLSIVLLAIITYFLVLYRRSVIV